MPVLIGFMLFNEVFGPTDSIVKLLMNIVTRAFEYQAGRHNPTFRRMHPSNNCADDFALKLGYKAELAQALIKLQIKNLSSMDADYYYSAYHYSHPILTERLKAIQWTGEKKAEFKNAPEKDAAAADVATGREL
jgi:STE24 endopeptidase